MTGPGTRTYACHNGDHDVCRGYTDGNETWRCPCPCHAPDDLLDGGDDA